MLYVGNCYGVWLSACVPPDDTVNSESVMDVKPGDSDVVIGCQLDEFSCILSAECFVA